MIATAAAAGIAGPQDRAGCLPSSRAIAAAIVSTQALPAPVSRRPARRRPRPLRRSLASSYRRPTAPAAARPESTHDTAAVPSVLPPAAEPEARAGSSHPAAPEAAPSPPPATPTPPAAPPKAPAPAPTPPLPPAPVVPPTPAPPVLNRRPASSCGEQDRGRGLRPSLGRRLGDCDLARPSERGRPERHVPVVADTPALFAVQPAIVPTERSRSPPPPTPTASP